MSCPSCKQEIKMNKDTPREVAQELGPLLSLKKKVEKEALKNAESQGILGDERLSTPGDFYYNKPQEFANHRCSFYMCNSCKVPYFGGLIDCEQEANNAQRKTKPEDLMCQDCLLKEIGAGQTTCEKHGKIQIDWKCMYCCSTALFCCFGTHYMCKPCHDEYNRTSNPPLKDCHGINCPLGIAHPPPNKDPKLGGVFPLGCGICRSEKMEMLQQRDVHQVISAENLPKAYIYNAQPAGPARPQIIRPDFEPELFDHFDALDQEEIRREGAAALPVMDENAAVRERQYQAMRRRLRADRRRFTLNALL